MTLLYNQLHTCELLCVYLPRQLIPHYRRNVLNILQALESRVPFTDERCDNVTQLADDLFPTIIG